MPSNPSHATVMIAHHSADGEYMHVSRYVRVCVILCMGNLYSIRVWLIMISSVFPSFFAATLQVTGNYF